MCRCNDCRYEPACDGSICRKYDYYEEENRMDYEYNYDCERELEREEEYDE